MVTTSALLATFALSSSAITAPVSFNAVVSLGDSLLDAGSDPRTPLVSEHIAERLGVPLTQLAVSGSTSSSLISGGQHTTAAASFGAGDLAVLWIGGNDFLTNSVAVSLGNFSFLNSLEANVDIILTTLVGAGMDVLVLNLPDFAQVPAVISATPAPLLPNFTAASLEWRTRLDALAATHGVAVADVYTFSQDVAANPDDYAVGGTPPVLPPSFGSPSSCTYCLFFDPIHPATMAQAIVANVAIPALNAFFGGPPLDEISQAEILRLVDPCTTPATVASRNPGASNPSSYTVAGSEAGRPVLGGTLSLFVNASGTTGHTNSTVLGYLSPTTSSLMAGQVLLLDVGDPAGEILQFGLQGGDTAILGAGIPVDSTLCGLSVFTQGVHLLGQQPFALSNAQDFTIGDV